MKICIPNHLNGFKTSPSTLYACTGTCFKTIKNDWRCTCSTFFLFLFFYNLFCIHNVGIKTVIYNKAFCSTNVHLFDKLLQTTLQFQNIFYSLIKLIYIWIIHFFLFLWFQSWIFCIIDPRCFKKIIVICWFAVIILCYYIIIIAILHSKNYVCCLFKPLI